jgi:hypothetical protein
MPLTDTAIRNAKPAAKAMKLNDGGGLYLLLTPKGGRWWRLDYAFSGKRKTLSMGVYPDVGLADARDRRNEAKKLLANGIDPGAVRKAQKTARQERAANSFEVVALEWFNVWKSKVAPLTAQRAWRNLELHVFPTIGKLPIAEIKFKTIAPVLQTMAARGLGNSVEKVKTSISQVMRLSVKKELAEQVPDLRDSFERLFIII